MDDQNSPQYKPLTSDEPPYVPSVDPVDSTVDPMVEPDTVADSAEIDDATSVVSGTAQPAAFDDSAASSMDSDTAVFSAEPTVSTATDPVTQAVPVMAAVPTATSPVGSVFGTGPAAPEPKVRKKGMLAVIIAAAAVVVLGGGSALAYNLYYQNEQKVVTDSFVNMMQAKTVEFTASMVTKDESSSGMNITVDVSGAAASGAGQVDAKISAKLDDKTYSVTAAGVIDDKSDLYFKVGDIKQIVDEFKVLMPADSQSIIDDIVAKVDDKWIKVDAEDMKDISADASKTQTCMMDAVEKFQGDKAATKQVGDLYRKNKFITVDEKLGSKDGSLGYVLSGDQEAFKAFGLSLKDTDLYKDLNKCDDSFTIDEDTFATDSAAADDNTRVELWVDRWSHQITKLSVVSAATATNKSTSTLVFEPVFNKRVTVQTPKDATTIKQLQKDIEALSDKFTSSMYGYSDSFDYES